MARLLLVFEIFFKALMPLLIIWLSSGRLAMAASPAGDIQRKIKKERVHAETVQKSLAKAKETMVKIKADEASVIRSLEQLNVRLNESLVRGRRLRSEIDRLEDKIRALNADRDALAEQMQGLKSHAVHRLVAYYKLSQLGIAPMLFSADSFFDLCQRRNDLQRILASDAGLWDKYQVQQERLAALSQTLTAKQAKQNSLFLQFQQEAQSVAQQRAGRTKLLASIQADKRSALASIASLRQTAKELDETIRSLERIPEPPATRSGSKSGGFVALKGALPLPVQGEVVVPFGHHKDQGRYHVRSFHTGVNIMADLGAPVRALCDGQVIYASWFKGYGNMMIIDHGEHYYTLSAQLEQVLKEKGDMVQTGEVVGTVGDTATLSGPGLYFEIRHYGKPLDPLLWFKK
jgi:septal ring factor EnvC (AmiA/AmiB activator)